MSSRAIPELSLKKQDVTQPRWPHGRLKIRIKRQIIEAMRISNCFGYYIRLGGEALMKTFKLSLGLLALALVLGLAHQAVHAQGTPVTSDNLMQSIQDAKSAAD